MPGRRQTFFAKAACADVDPLAGQDLATCAFADNDRPGRCAWWKVAFPVTDMAVSEDPEL